MIDIDLYYNDQKEAADKVTTFWSDTRCCYWGYIYRNKKIIGDFNANTIQEVQKAFSHLNK